MLAVEEAAGLKALRLAIDSGHEVVAVLTTATEARGSSAWRLARDHEIEIHEPARVRAPSFADWIESAKIDLLINVHSLHIAGAKVVSAPSIGSFNLHPGPLPDYRGLNAPSWAIYDGRDSHAVTLHWMTAEVDAGRIAYESRFELDPACTGLKVSARCVELGLGLIERLLQDAVTGEIPRYSQPDRPSVWHGREAPNGGWVDWREPAWRIAAAVRAANFHPFPSPWGWPKARLESSVVELVEVQATCEPSGAEPGQVRVSAHEGVSVAAGDAWLKLSKLKLDGKTRPASELLEAAIRLA